jgi:hypothetical protein
LTALKIIGIILLVFLLIGFLRVGALVSFGDELRVMLCAGPVRLTILPKKKKRKKEKAEGQKGEKKEKKPKKKRALPKPTLSELLDLAETALSALGATVWRACKRLRVDPLDVTVVFGGADPADVAIAFGAVNAAVYTIMPRAEETFCIPDPALHLRMDYGAEQTTAEGNVGVSLRVCDLFAIAFTLILPLGKWFLRFKKAHRSDTAPHKVAAPAEEKQSAGEDQEKIA